MNQSNNGFGMQFGGGNGGNNGDGNRPASQSQLATYAKLCRQKGVTPQNVHGATYESVSGMIQELIDKPNPASEPQFNLILQLTEQMGLTISQEILKTLNVVTAGTLITQLREKQRTMRETIPATEAQVRLMMEMYLCPDVNYEYLNIPNKIELGYNIARQDGSQISAWRLHTPDELNAYLIRVTQQAASDFINNFRDVYSTWKKSRLTQSQVESIRNLERAMSNVGGAGRPVTEATMIDGTNIVIAPITNADRTRRDKTVAYIPLENYALQQFDQTSASAYIQMLRDEIYNQDRYKDANDEVNAVEDLRDQHIQRSVKTLDWNDLNNVLHKLLAVAGVEDEELLESCLDTCDTGMSESEIIKAENYIRSFMRNCVRRGDITPSGLITLIESSEYAVEILTGAKFPKK